jgi:3-oxoacyl-[acyl-carrier protein] reductase
MPLLEGRVAVVTGGAQGIGLEIARSVISAGGKVVIGDTNFDVAQAAAHDLGDAAIARECNVTSDGDVRALVAAAIETFGSLDIMVNNAGITRDATMKNMSEADFDSVVAVSLKGTWNGTRIAAEHMREQRKGSIINLSSISGKVGFFGQTNYSAAKAGVVGLTKAAAKEVARYGVRVNAIQPGLVITPMTEVMSEEIWAQKLAEVPLQRAAQPAEIASVVIFLASEMSSYITGSVIEVTGGRYM